MVRLAENILIAYNPNSGKGKGATHARRIQRHLVKRGAHVGLVLGTKSIESVYDFCMGGMDYTLIIVVGGDGTLSYWVDALVKNEHEIPVYAYGRGTANDFATYFKTNKSAKKTAKIICETPKVRSIDLLELDEASIQKYAVNVACGGAFTNGVTKYSKQGKRLFGKMAYFWGAFKVFMTMKPQAVELDIDGEGYSSEIYFFLILNTPNAGSIKGISPLAIPDDGYLNLVAWKKCGFFRRLFLVLGLLFGCTKNNSLMHLKGKSFTITPKGKTNSNFTITDIDGNAGDNYPLKVNVATKQFKVLTNK